MCSENLACLCFLASQLCVLDHDPRSMEETKKNFFLVLSLVFWFSNFSCRSNLTGSGRELAKETPALPGTAHSPLWIQ